MDSSNLMYESLDAEADFIRGNEVCSFCDSLITERVIYDIPAERMGFVADNTCGDNRCSAEAERRLLERVEG